MFRFKTNKKDRKIEVLEHEVLLLSRENERLRKREEKLFKPLRITKVVATEYLNGAVTKNIIKKDMARDLASYICDKADLKSEETENGIEYSITIFTDLPQNEVKNEKR